MQILLGVVSQLEKEQLFVLEEGKCVLMPADEQSTAAFGNYDLLKARPLYIQEEPVSGSGVFRFRYGPVTSGIREAGCFYLYTFGEKILRAGIDLNWKHRGLELAMKGLSLEKGTALAEKVCSNFSVAHSVAYARAIEEALGINVDLATRNWRIMLLEAERVYNHLHVIYKLSGAAAQKVLASHLSALFEKALRLNALLTSSRFLTGINGIGSLLQPVATANLKAVVQGYEEMAEKFTELYKHSLSNSNYLDRLHDSGKLSAELAQQLGLTGPSLRACGIDDHLNGSGIKHFNDLPVVTQNEGDALARMEIRSEELVNSCKFLAVHLQESDTWQTDRKKAGNSAQNGSGCGVANSASGAVGYHVDVDEGLIKSVNIFSPSYVGMHAISAVLEELVFTDFPFVFDSFGVHFTDASR